MPGARSRLGQLLATVGQAASRLAPLADGVATMKERAEQGMCVNCGNQPRLNEKIPTCGDCTRLVGQGALDVVVDVMEGRR